MSNQRSVQNIGGAGETARLLHTQARSKPWMVALITGVLTVAPLGQTSPVWSAEGKAGRSGGATVGSCSRETLTVANNQSRVFKLQTETSRVSIAQPAIADILVLDPRQIYVVGKALGSTNVMLWEGQEGKERLRGCITIEVTPDMELLKTRLHEVMPGEGVEVRSAQGSLVVSGQVTSGSKADAAMKIAQSFAEKAGAPPDKVLNLLQVGGSQQVLLEVKVAELSRDIAKSIEGNLGIFYTGGGFKMGTVGKQGGYYPSQIAYPAQLDSRQTTIDNTVDSARTNSSNNNSALNDALGWGSQSGITGGSTSAASALGAAALGAATSALTQTINRSSATALSPFIANPTGTGWVTGRGIFSSFLGGNWLVNATLEAAKNNGQARILAEPNLTTLSGQEANFLAGGQIPYPTPAALGATPGVDYKDYGVKLQFVPVVLDSGVISLKLYVSVSDLDYANGIQLVGASTITPALKTRLANSTVEIQSGQTISIAGILDERLVDTIDKFPALGDIPILGMMFRSQAYRKKQSELVIFVTPRLAQPFDTKKIKTPLAADSFVAPSDMEFYLLGRNRPSRPQQNAPATPSSQAAPSGTLGPDQAGSEGHFGHDL